MNIDNIMKSLSTQQNNHIAIIGLDCTLSNYEGQEEVLSLIRYNRNGIRTIPYNRKKIYDISFVGQSSRNYIPLGYINDIDAFDYKFFNMPLEEAKLTDPRQRLFLQSAWRTIEDAGYRIDNLPDDTGVFLGLSNDRGNEYAEILKYLDSQSKQVSTAGNIQSIIASRISYLLDLKGPAIVIDSACSSSMVALHTAIQSIINDDCSQAIVGGVNLKIKPKLLKEHEVNVGNVSDSFLTRAFDVNANGTNSGEGFGSILIKKLDKAIENKDNIYSVILGSALNQDGKSNGITSPNGESQEEVIKKAWKKAKVHAEDFSFIEAHGTGTIIGDPIEFNALNKVFNEQTSKKQFCALTSIKSNIGHTDSFSGLAGIIKSALCLKNGIIPASRNFAQPNNSIDILNSSLYINKNTKINRKSKKICGVSSFSINGTNAHVVMSDFKLEENSHPPNCKKIPLLFSAENISILINYLRRFLTFLKTTKYSIFAISQTLNTSKRQMKCRLGLAVRNKDEAITILEEIMKNGINANVNNDYKFNIIKDKHFFFHDYINKFKQKAINISEKSTCYDIVNLFTYNEYLNLDGYYFNSNFTKVSLPSYPFSKEKVWATSYFDHLLGFKIYESEEKCIFENKFQKNSNWILKEHHIDNNSVFPGTTYIEMATRFVQKKYDKIKGLDIKNVHFFNLLKIKDNEEITLRFIIKSHTNKFIFQVIQMKNNSEYQKIAELELRIFNERLNNTINIDEIINRMHSQIDLDNIDENNIRKDTINLGKHWDTTRKVFYNNNEVFCKLSLDTKFQEEDKRYLFHPSLMDCAVNSANFTLEEGFYLPYFYKKISFYNSVPNEIFVLITKPEPIQSNDLGEFDVKVANKKGEIICEINNYTVKKVNPHKNDDLTYQYILEKREEKLYAKPKRKLLVYENYNDTLFQRLKDNGFSPISIDNLNELYSNNNKEVIDVLLTSDKTDSLKSLKLFLEKIKQLYSLISVDTKIFYINKQSTTKNVMASNPFEQAKEGLIKVLGKEKNKNNIKLITYDEKTNFEKILNEMKNNSVHKEVKYYNNERYVKVLKKFNVPVSPIPQKSKIKKNILIVGGLGGLGIELTNYLIKNNNIIIIGRSELKLIKNKLASLKNKANIYKTNLSYFKVDISDKENSSKKLKKISEIYNQIDDIYITVGNEPLGFINNIDSSNFIENISSVIIGTEILLSTFKDKGLKNFISFSSINTLLGVPGEADYIVANSYMDGFSEWASQIYSHINFKTISWGGWNKTGLRKKIISNNNSGFKPLSPQIALENMAKVIDQKDKYIIIADLEEDKVSALSNTTGLYFSNKNFLEKTRNPDNLKETRNTKTTSEQNINEVVSKIWQNLFGLKNINPDTKFFDLGGDSILATYLFKELEQHFEGLIDISDIFTYPSINSISKYIYSAQKYNDKNIRYKNDSLDDKLQKLKNGELSVSDLENEV